MAADKWQAATVERGKPRIYIQQFLDLKLPEADYKSIVKEMGLSKTFSEETGMRVMEAYLEAIDDGSQCDAVHMQQGDGLVVLMTVASFPYRQETFDHLMATHIARKAFGGGS